MNKKILIAIIILLIIVGGVTLFFVLKKPIQQSRCGDGVCGEIEKANPNLCPEDCGEEPLTSKYQDSPFGIFGPYEFMLNSKVVGYEQINDYLSDLGVKWVQEMPKGINNVSSSINLYSRVGREGGVTPPNIDYDKYKNALRELIKQHKDRVKYWEVDTEESGRTPPYGWLGNETEYVVFLKESYSVIKSECPDCIVVLGGMPGVTSNKINENNQNVLFLKSILTAGAGNYFDAFEFKQHYYSADGYTGLKNKMEVYGNTLSQYGIDIKKIPVFIETATYDGNPHMTSKYPLFFLNSKLSPQTEFQQAAGLVKINIFAIVQGIDKILWNGVYERYNVGNQTGEPYNYYGLVNNPQNEDGLSHKKLSYYTYKKMVETLEGSDWNNIQTVQESDGIYIYKFTKNNKPIWVAWNDNSGDKQITISGITSSQVKITEAIPKYDSGKDATDYNTAFNTETKTVSGGKISLTLRETPVFMEER